MTYDDALARIAIWMSEQGWATGHGDRLEDLLDEIKACATLREQERCAEIANSFDSGTNDCGIESLGNIAAKLIADAIRNTP